MCTDEIRSCAFRPPSFKRMMAAKKAMIDTWPIEQLGVDLSQNLTYTKVAMGFPEFLPSFHLIW